MINPNGQFAINLTSQGDKLIDNVINYILD